MGANGGFVSYNLFAYCNNDPINQKDDGGDCPVVIVGAVVGGIAGLLGQAAGDIFSYCLYGKKSFSPGKYLGAFVGGAVGGAVLVCTGNTGLSGAASGFATTFLGQATDKLTGRNPNRSWDDIIARSALDGAMGYAFGSCLNLLPKGIGEKFRIEMDGIIEDIFVKWEASGGKAILKQFVCGLPLNFYCAFKPYAK